jgi:hypothetical protein
MVISQYQGVIGFGLQLAETPESEGGWKEYFEESDAGDLRIEDEFLRASTAVMLENCKMHLLGELPASLSRRARMSNGLYRLDETTRSALVGGFSDYLFPVIRAGFPTNPITELVAVQPTTRRIATVVYWNWIVGRSKGSYTQGQRLFDANRGKQDSGFNFSNEVIAGEPIAALGGANATNSGTLAYNDGGGVRPNTVRLLLTTSIAAGVAFVDNGNGAFITPAGHTALAASSINYQTGAWSITLAGGETFTTATDNTAHYRWDSEGSQSLAEVDVQIVTSTAETERRAMRINYSAESMQDVMSEFGVSLEPNLVTGAAEQMNFEIARQLISEMWNGVPVASSFSLTTPGGISQQDHFRDIGYQLNLASNTIWSNTQKAVGNWLVVDTGAASLLESLPASMFVRAPQSSLHGLHYIGTLLGQYRVYKDLHLSSEPGASAQGNILMGYKGTQFFEAGLVWAPYQLLYTTPSLQTADFVTQKGLATRYATKMVNKDMYIRVNLAA